MTMESNKNRIWLFVFLAVLALGGFAWWRGSGQPETPAAPAPGAPEPSTLGTESPAGDFQARPAFPPGANPGAPSAPAAPAPRIEQRRADPVSPHLENAPPPGFTPPPTTFESFAPPPDPNGYDDVPMDPPPSAFEQVPPQAFENPEFVTPQPPPPQFETEPLPLEEMPPPFDQGGGGGVEPFPEGDEDF